MSERITYSTERLGALSDGVFAIVLTLLVLDLKIPELPPQHAEQRMLADLAGQIPNLVAWVISFVLLARLWVVHHAVLATLGRCHNGTIAWNFVVLGLVSLVPFAAGLIGTYEYDPLALAVFATVLGATGLAIGCLARHAATEVRLHRAEQSDDDNTWHWRYHAWVLPGFAITSILLLGVAEVAALAVWIVEPAVALAGSARRRGERVAQSSR